MRGVREGIVIQNGLETQLDSLAFCSLLWKFVHGTKHILFWQHFDSIAQPCYLNINKPKTKDVHVVRYGSISTAANLLATLKFAEFTDHISIDYGEGGFDCIYIYTLCEKCTYLF